MPALRHTQLDGTLFWVVNEQNLVIDAPPDAANAAGLPVSSYIGSYAHEVGHQIREPSLEARQKRRERLFREGGSDTLYFWADLEGGKGWTYAVVTTTRITHPDTGKHYLISSAHDITDILAQLDYLRAPAFQRLIMLIIESNGKVLAATDAAATFYNPSLTRGQQLHDQTIDQAQWKDLREREKEQVALSKQFDKPANAIEWLLNGSGDYRPYAVSRIAFPKGRWMIVMMPVPLTEPYLQLTDIEDVVRANNLSQPATVTSGEFQTLVDMHNKVPREDLAEREGISVDGIDKRRQRLAAKFKLASVDDLLTAIAYTELGYLVQLYAQRICPDGNCDEK